METESKTPKFNLMLDEILENLEPQEYQCIQKDISEYCEVKFKITDEDIKFYKKLRVPPPKCCPTCRRQRRFASVNRINFYKRNNDAPDSKEKIISNVPPTSPLIVYDLDYYRSTNWDPLSFAQKYDSETSFFNQFYELRLKVPQYAIIRDSSSINSEFSLNGKNLKNGYFVSGGHNSENVWYSIFVNNSREVMYSQDVTNCDRCYEIIMGKNLSLCNFCYFSKDCISSQFIFDCRNCQDCFGCVNLHNKRYCFFNEQLSEIDYREKIKLLNLESRLNFLKTTEYFWKFVKSNPIRASRSMNNIDSTGVLILNSKNCHDVTSCENGENNRYVDMAMDVRDSMDVYTAGKSEMLYETSAVATDSANIKFSSGSKYVTNSEFLINYHNCQYCFACIGLENRNYCIFNKSFTPEDYFKEIDRIKSSLLKKSEYGDFFPAEFSSFAYNGSEASLSYPLNKEETEKFGALYQPEIDTDTQGLDVLLPKDVPDSIDDVTDNILDKALICEKSGRPFRIVKSELEFYRKFKLPIQTIHPLLRMKNTFEYLGNNLFYKGVCKQCGIQLETIYKVDAGWSLYCEQCYKKEIY